MKQNLRELTYHLQLIKRQLLPNSESKKTDVDTLLAQDTLQRSEGIEEEARDIFQIHKLPRISISLIFHFHKTYAIYFTQREGN